MTHGRADYEDIIMSRMPLFQNTQGLCTYIGVMTPRRLSRLGRSIIRLAGLFAITYIVMLILGFVVGPMPALRGNVMQMEVAESPALDNERDIKYIQSKEDRHEGLLNISRKMNFTLENVDGGPGNLYYIFL